MSHAADQVFAKYDTDNDGFLTEVELAPFHANAITTNTTME